MDDAIGLREFHEAEGAEHWRIVSDGAAAFFQTSSLAQSAEFVQQIASLPGLNAAPPDIDIRPDGVTVRILTLTSDYCGLTHRDLETARTISRTATALGLTANPARVQSVLIIPGASDVSTIIPFWQAVLGYERRPDSPDEDLVDPRGRGPALWFENMEQLREDGGGSVHIAVWVPHDQYEARRDAALAAGGRIVRDRFAPAWLTLADAAGNEIDISTTLMRDGPPPPN